MRKIKDNLVNISLKCVVILTERVVKNDRWTVCLEDFIKNCLRWFLKEKIGICPARMESIVLNSDEKKYLRGGNTIE